jgi:hypothetical protein
MARFNYSLTEDKIEKWIAEGRGTGTGKDYKPWLTVPDVPSKGRRSRRFGIVTGRPHDLMSNGEDDTFAIYDISPYTRDIKEQVPLLPREETLLIAEKKGIKHPRDPKTQVPIVMTTDFLITIEINGQLMTIARTIKQLSELNQLRVLEKLEIERTYYQCRNIDWGIIIKEHIPKYLAENCQFFSDYFFLRNIQIEECDLNDIYSKLTPLVLKEDTALRLIAKQCDRDLALTAGSSLKAALYFIANRQWQINWKEKFNTGDILRASVLNS